MNENIKTVQVDELSRQLAGDNGPQVVDIRPGDDYAAGHIPGAVNIPLLRLDYGPGFVPDERPVVICGWGQDDMENSHQAAQVLQQRGLKTSVLEGGFNAWRHSGKPVDLD